MRREGLEGGKSRWLSASKVRPGERLAQLKGRAWSRLEILGTRPALWRKVINRCLVRIRAVFS